MIRRPPRSTLSLHDALPISPAAGSAIALLKTSRGWTSELFRMPEETSTCRRRWLARSEEHTSELQSHSDLVCRLLLEKKNKPNSAEHGTASTSLRSQPVHHS